MNLVDLGRIAGWAQDLGQPNVPVRLEVVIAGKVVADAVADRYREELRRAGVGNGEHGFEIAMPQGLGKSASLQVRRAADGTVLEGWPDGVKGRAWRMPALASMER